MVPVPGATPVTTPVLPTVAIDVLDELHVPPVTLSANVMVAPTYTDDGPVMVDTDGVGVTVTLTLSTQLLIPLLIVT